MKKILCVLLSILIVIPSMSMTLMGCKAKEEEPQANAMSITFDNMSKEELDSQHLEVKADNKITFVENNNSDFAIYVKEDASNSLLRAVEELKNIVYEMSGANLEIKHEITNGAKGIFVGDIYDQNLQGVEHDGFIIDITDDRIAIRGIEDEGSRNGVYTFIENYLGALFVSYDNTYIPHHDNIYLEKGSKVDNPRTPWRNMYCVEASQNLWAAKLKLNGYNVELDDDELEFDKEPETKEQAIKKGNEARQYNEWGTWCHDYYQFLSPEEYFEDHPEYFSLRKGKRIYKHKTRQGHLCLSNPEVYDIVEANLLKKIEENPDKKYWDFSCNDSTVVRGCECENCKKMDEEAGGTGMGSLLPFINKLARKVKEVYPDKEIYISTLAYIHTTKAPTNGLKAEPNVVIKLCSMPGDQGTSYLNPGNPYAQGFHDHLKSWGAVADHVIVWDYVVDFHNLLMPFPNFAVQRENQQFYEENNIQGIFHQASREVGGEMSKLRCYVLSKLMWEGSTMDVAKEVSRFVGAYYGDASDEIIEYLNLTHKNLSDTTSALRLYATIGAHYNGYLSEENVRKYESIIDRAKEDVKDDPLALSRVEEVELNVKYVKMQLPKIDDAERKETFDRVNELCKEKEITMVREVESLEKFNSNFDKAVWDVEYEVNKTLYDTIAIVGGVVLATGIIAIGVVIFVKVKKKKKK